MLIRSDKEKAKQDSSGFQDILMTANETFAYTRGSKEEIYIRKYDNGDYKKTIKMPHSLVFFSYTPDGNQLVALVGVVSFIVIVKAGFIHANFVCRFFISKKISRQCKDLLDFPIFELGTDFDKLWF